MIRLPHELIDAIIDHLHDDEPSLSICSLVCKSWTRTARYHLYADINIDKGGTNDLRLLQRGSPVIIYIRRLRIMVYLGWKFWNETLPSLSNFESIQSISIGYLPWCSMLPSARSAFLSRFAAITRLYLYGIEVSTFHQLAQMIYAFTWLDTLIINKIKPGVFQLPMTALRAPKSLRAVEFRDFDSRMLSHWLGSSGITLRSVSLRRIPCRDIQSFMEAIGPSLEEFWCEPRFGSSYGTLLLTDIKIMTYGIRLTRART
jgi:hypothetical protein